MASNKDVMVGDYWRRGRCNLALIRNTEVGWNDLRFLLDSLVLGGTPGDTFIKRWESTDMFTIKSMYKQLIDGALDYAMEI